MHEHAAVRGTEEPCPPAACPWPGAGASRGRTHGARRRGPPTPKRRPLGERSATLAWARSTNIDSRFREGLPRGRATSAANASRRGARGAASSIRPWAVARSPSGVADGHGRRRPRAGFVQEERGGVRTSTVRRPNGGRGPGAATGESWLRWVRAVRGGRLAQWVMRHGVPGPAVRP